LVLVLALSAALPPAALALTASQVYEQVKDSVVVVKAYDQKGKPVGLGSGVMLPSGDIITNYHVVKSGARYTVGRGKQAAPATLKGVDEEKDLCLLAAPGLVAEPARLGKTDRLKVGDKVYGVGAPQGLELSLSEGIVSQLRSGPPPIIQTTVAISKGSSGGGLFNAEGELVGITTFYLKDGQSLNFALPVEWISQVAGRKPPERGSIIIANAKAELARRKNWKDRAIALKESQDWQSLLEWSRQETKAAPGNESAWFFLGLAYRMLGRYSDAISASREALRCNPDYADAWHNLGFAYLELGRFQDSIEAFREVLRIKPHDAMSWGNLALIYAVSGNRSAALEAVKELRRYDPKEADKLFNLIMQP